MDLTIRKTFLLVCAKDTNWSAKDEYPDFEAPVVDEGKYAGVFGVGGLVLARIPLETVAER